jgi:hypothetical protein
MCLDGERGGPVLLLAVRTTVFVLFLHFFDQIVQQSDKLNSKRVRSKQIKMRAIAFLHVIHRTIEEIRRCLIHTSNQESFSQHSAYPL